MERDRSHVAKTDRNFRRSQRGLRLVESDTAQVHCMMDAPVSELRPCDAAHAHAWQICVRHQMYCSRELAKVSARGRKLGTPMLHVQGGFRDRARCNIDARDDVEIFWLLQISPSPELLLYLLRYTVVVQIIAHIMRLLYATAFVATVATANIIPVGLLQERVTCPVNSSLAQPYENPSLIIQVSQKNPDKQYGATTNPKITPNDLCAAINLKLPPEAVGRICRLSFKIPTHDQTKSHFNYAGLGHFQFQGFFPGFGADVNTTYNNQPPKGPSPSSPPYIGPGNSYNLLQFPCLAIPLAPYTLVGGMLCSNDTTFDWVNSDATCPLGFFNEVLDINADSLGGIHT